MKEIKKFSIISRLKSFKHASSGLKIFFRHEHNARVQFVIASIILIVGGFLHLSLIEWSIITVTIFLVFITEILNSSIEYLATHVSAEYHEVIKIVKDLAAAAVLVASISSVIVGILIFLPKIISKTYV